MTTHAVTALFTTPTLVPSPSRAPARLKAPDAPISLVNLAARQRMLSQRVILQTVLAVTRNDERALQSAHKTFQLFCDSQAQLQATADQLDSQSAQQIHDAYQGPQGVGATIGQFMHLVQTTLQGIAQADRQVRRSLSALVDSTDTVLEALNVATTAFDNITKGKADVLMQELSSIVSDIQTVAREAKVVSFNAQVIAARAGDSGREFAVVAQVLSGITTEIDGLSRKAVDLAIRNRPVV